jgi:cyclic lactone autoinducer peptide
MRKLFIKFVEIYAKSSTNSCFFLVFHQTKVPKCLLQK